MQNAHWESLAKVIEIKISPLLKQLGYSYQEPEDTESGGFYLVYTLSHDNYPEIVIHAVKKPNLEYGKKPDYVSFLQVNLGATLLKTLQDTSSEKHSFLTIGWVYTEDAEMLDCVQEIVVGLKRFFNQS